jgi:hypothetical protein
LRSQAHNARRIPLKIADRWVELGESYFHSGSNLEYESSPQNANHRAILSARHKNAVGSLIRFG